MKNAGLLFFSVLSFLSPALFGQVPGYTLVKTAAVGQSSGYQLVASNTTSSSGNFFILENIPANETFQSIIPNSPLASALPASGALPSTGPATMTIGPFSLAAGASVTFQVAETPQANSNTSPGQTITGDTFALVSQSQLSGNNSNGSAPLASGRGLVETTAVFPNISREGQPVQFLVNLNASARLNLVIFALTGERVFDIQAQGNGGVNKLIWNAQNNAGQSVASGLYVYVLQIFGNGTEETRTGKIVVIH